MNELTSLIALFLASDEPPLRALGLGDREVLRGPWWFGSVDVSGHPRFQRAQLDYHHGQISGAHLWLSEPCRVSWEQARVAFGPSMEELVTMDDWGGPTPHRFGLAASAERVRGTVTLWIAPEVRDPSGYIGETPTTPLVERLTLRRFPARGAS